jgi:hypothetical protein
MDFSSEPKPTTDGLACSGCAIGDCPAGQDRDDSPLSGWRLAVASMLLLLGPCILAIAGAVWFRGSEWAQLCGALAGLGIGMGAAMVAAKRLWRADPAEVTKTSG